MKLKVTLFDFTEDDVYEVIETGVIEADNMKEMMENERFGEAISSLLEGKFGEFQQVKLERIDDAT
jgi:hypothetical protein